MPVFDFQDASLKGDRNWSRVGKFTSLAPLVVLNLLILSIIQVALGAIHITGVSNDLTFAQVIQPLVVPALSFFNTVPSLHLHVLARSNKPLMAMIFSSIMSAVYLASAVVFLPPCSAGFAPPRTQSMSASNTLGQDRNAYQDTECPPGTRVGIWGTMVALQFISAIGYAVHFTMAWRVHNATKRREQDEREGRVMVVIDPVEKAKREEEARKRWTEIRDL